MQKNKKRAWLAWMAALLLAAFLPTAASAAEKQTIYNSPYVTFSPDGKAWTTNAGEKDYTWYDKGTTVSTGISSTLRQLKTGEHYYKAEREGEIPIGFWKVRHRPAQCIHNGYPTDDFYYHGVPYGKKKCGKYYYSGWTPYCADCGEMLLDMYFYMSREAAQSIDYLDSGSKEDFAYYYLCPHCTNLEQGSNLQVHECKAISWNQYKVEYDVNTEKTYGGYMTDSIHMYNNATKYDGEEVTPITRLTKNTYTRIGYEFVEWNTKPDGSGTAYQDEAEILNLTDIDCNNADTWTETNEGKVTLYAQWRPSSGTLVLDANGGTYNGKERELVVKSYGQKYVIDSSQVQAPSGYRVSFEANGGEAVAPITGTQHFTEWSMEQPFQGRMKEGAYYFIAPDGNIDTLQAHYTPDPVTLPDASRPGSSFGGWYYDRELTRPAGGPGDSFLPLQDVTLYAQWVDLTLKAEDNYRALGGRGAVDLSWSQSDNRNKTYLLYQSLDGEHFTKIHGAEDISDTHKIREAFGFAEEARQYRVPSTGLYLLTAEGAQGGDYGGFAGGLGGQVAAKVWLTKGELLTCVTGGQKGFNGGGSGSLFANGGGSTVVATDQKGTIMIAGGGGGASSLGNGNPGGSSASVTGSPSPSGACGQSGGAGGGGGYQGGSAGELIVHHHTEDCYYQEELGYPYPSPVENRIEGWGLSEARRFAGNPAGSREGSYVLNEAGMTEGCLLPVKGNKTLELTLSAHAWDDDALSSYIRIEVYNEKKQKLYEYQADATGEDSSQSPGHSWEEEDGWHGTPSSFRIEKTLSVPVEGTEGVWIAYSMGTTHEEDGGPWAACHYSFSVSNIALAGGVKNHLICGYQEGQVLSARPAYGGSNYVNPAWVTEVTQTAGARKGDGTVFLESVSIGYQEGLSLEGVKATDLAVPDPVKEAGITKTALTDKQVSLTWTEPADGGTDYYHQAQSCQQGSTALLCTSNVTKNTLVSGIRGYYWIVDGNPDTRAGAENGRFTEERALTVTAGEAPVYAHVAAVDVAGNISQTTHIRIEEKEVLWKLYTKPLQIEEGENIYRAGENRFYVRADGETPFLLTHEGYLDGTASLGYQPNYSIFYSETESTQAKNLVYTRSHPISDQNILTGAEELLYRAEGPTLLLQYPYLMTERSSCNRELKTTEKFALDRAAHGKTIKVYPGVGADYIKAGRKEVHYSEEVKDRQNGLILMGDGEAPFISGLEPLADKELLDCREGIITLQITAADNLSGVRELRAEIYNTDNTAKKTYLPDEAGTIRIDLTEEEPIFSGDFVVTVTAVDNVGNIREEVCSTTEFALETSVERILEPHEPVFKAGESGILTITTWGYADRVEVEFPEELTALNPELNHTYEYTESPGYQKQERLQFMIPLYAPENQQFVITVRAYKGDKQLEEHPSLSIQEEGGSILQDFRTRLR